jgi:hypothetical protein
MLLAMLLAMLLVAMLLAILAAVFPLSIFPHGAYGRVTLPKKILPTFNAIERAP